MLTRLQRVHAKFLESCRSLSGGRGYWDNVGPLRKWFAQLITPIPLLALDDGGRTLYDALLWLEANCRSTPLSEDVIRHYHRTLAPKSPEPTGEYRRGKIVIERSAYAPPPASRIPLLMKQLNENAAKEQKRMDASNEPGDALRRAVNVHHQIVWIHPFADGNGRVARLAMNHLLRRYGLPYVILPPLSEAGEHFEALEEANAGRLERLVSIADRHQYRV